MQRCKVIISIIALLLPLRVMAQPTYMLTYDHGGHILWTTAHFGEKLREAISWLDRYPSFKFGLDNEVYAYDRWAEEVPELLEELKGYFRHYSGRFGLGSVTYGQPLSTFINEESNVRQLTYAIRTNLRHFNQTPPIYAMSEHGMHSQIPQLLVQTGHFSGAIMRTHFMMYGYNPTYNAAFGWWVGMDGSRIPTIPTYDGEGATFAATTTDNRILTRWPCRMEEIPGLEGGMEAWRQDFSHIQPQVASRLDDTNLKCEELVSHLEGNPDFQWILMEDLLSKFPARPGVDFRPGPNDFITRMPWGYCGNEIFDGIRAAEVDVLTAERLAAIELLLGVSGYEADLETAWKQLLVAQHHDITIVGLLDDAREFIPASSAAAARIMDASMDDLSRRMAAEGLGQITVFNPLSWTRTSWIEAHVTLSQGQANAINIRRDGETVPATLVSVSRYPDGSIDGATVGFYATLPGVSVHAFSMVAGDEQSETGMPRVVADQARLRITTPLYEVQLTPSGRIGSITELSSGTVVATDGLLAGRIDGQHHTGSHTWSLEGVPGVAVARGSGSVGTIPYEVELKFYADRPDIESRVRFRINGEKIGSTDAPKPGWDDPNAWIHEQKLRFRMHPSAGSGAVGVRDLPFVISETPDRYVEGIYWTALTDNRNGLAFFNTGQMGSSREADGSFSIALAYYGAYQWRDRPLNGDFEYRFAIHPFIGAWQDADIHKRALEYQFPMVTRVGPIGDGSLGTEYRVLQVDSDNVILSAFYPENGNVFARMYEYKGLSGTAQVMLFGVPVALTETDLMGDPGSAVPNPVSFSPWKIRTFRLGNIAAVRSSESS
jgi:alpha-mannosidase